MALCMSFGEHQLWIRPNGTMKATDPRAEWCLCCHLVIFCCCCCWDWIRFWIPLQICGYWSFVGTHTAKKKTRIQNIHLKSFVVNQNFWLHKNFESHFRHSLRFLVFSRLTWSMSSKKSYNYSFVLAFKRALLVFKIYILYEYVTFLFIVSLSLSLFLLKLMNTYILSASRFRFYLKLNFFYIIFWVFLGISYSGNVASGLNAASCRQFWM